MRDSVTNWKRYTANRFGVDWQRDFFDHRIRHDESLDAKADYIRMNPVRKGLCERPEDWEHVWSYRDLEVS